MSFWDAATADAGGQLTEREFFAAMDAMRTWPPAPRSLVVSRSVIERALQAADGLEARADALELELAGMRRWRWLRRRKVRRLLGESLAGAAALRGTFGRVA